MVPSFGMWEFDVPGNGRGEGGWEGGSKGGGRGGASTSSRSVNVSYGIVNLASDFLCFPLFSLEKPQEAPPR